MLIFLCWTFLVELFPRCDVGEYLVNFWVSQVLSQVRYSFETNGGEWMVMRKVRPNEVIISCVVWLVEEISLIWERNFVPLKTSYVNFHTKHVNKNVINFDWEPLFSSSFVTFNFQNRILKQKILYIKWKRDLYKFCKYVWIFALCLFKMANLL